MKKIFTIASFLTLFAANAQFTSGNVNLGTTGMVVKLEVNATTATLILSGNSTSYLGIGFAGQGQGMSNNTDGFIFNSQNSLDYTFKGVGLSPTADATQDWTVVSNNVSGSTRTIVATRSLAGGTGDFTFTNAAGNVAIAYAKGSSLALADHGTTNRGYATLVMTAAASSAEFAAQSVKVYPNPVGEVLNIENANQLEQITFYDTIGRKVKTIATNGKESIDVSSLQAGTYIVEYQLLDKNISYDKIIKN